MTPCAICGEPCPGHADTSSPFCAWCITANFSGSDIERWSALRAEDAPLESVMRQIAHAQLCGWLGQVSAGHRDRAAPDTR